MLKNSILLLSVSTLLSPIVVSDCFNAAQKNWIETEPMEKWQSFLSGPRPYATLLDFKFLMLNHCFRFTGPFTKSKAPWAAHGWIVQSQVYFCPCGKTSRLCAKLLVSKYIAPVQSLSRKSSDFHDFHGETFCTSIRSANGNSDGGSQSLHMCQAAHQASTDKNNLTKKTIYRPLVVCSQCPITKL